MLTLTPKNKLTFLSKFRIHRNNLTLEILSIALLITPLLNIIDIAWMFTHTFVEQWYVVHTPLCIKLIKDILLILLIAVSLKSIFRAPKTIFWIFISFCLIYIFEVIFSYYQHASIGLIISGARWFTPLFLFPLLYNSKLSQEEFLRFIARYRIILCITVILQILQTMFSTRWGECSGDGCRASGFFAMPQPQSLFSLLFLFFSSELKTYKFKKFDNVIAILSVALTKSGAGFLGLGIFFFVNVPKKFKIFSGIFSIIFISLFPILTGRGTFWESPKTRLWLLLNHNYQIPQFGIFTNACFNVFRIQAFNGNICKVPDSFLVSLLGNLGFYIALIILGIIFYLIYNSKKYTYFAILGVLLMGGSYSEYFPICLFLPYLINLKVEQSTENEA
jgi:hypothetical protein